ncbi:hypothetical protein E1176_17195 [Fulvivirga sp. RKSG066]|uniref:hypothetical protein n=1 Tax=Fulvivirga aurantia TaxID=2529383 RepID=UPI0012BC8CB6|nr:hypothetical protein [Fulvivirga aurantia]MTI22771.1 hypothetical protein [Fulvivirga aurantia]
MKALKNLVIACIILHILGSALTVPLIYVDFELRRDYISKVLCIKKDEPITVCGGQCFLAKQLNKAEKQHQDAQNSPRVEQISFFSEAIKQHSHIRNYEVVDLVFGHYLGHNQPRGFIHEIFHPPQI